MYISAINGLLINIVVSVVGLLINWKHLRDMKEDNTSSPPGTSPNLLTPILTTNTKVVMVFIPIYMFMFWILHEEEEIPSWVQYALCYDQYISTTVRTYLGFNSFVIATMRYVFICYNDRVLEFGKEKAKTLFYYGSIFIPVVIGVLNACSVKLPLNVHLPSHTVCIEYYLGYLNITREQSDQLPDFGSPILELVHKYLGTDFTQYVEMFCIIVGFVIYSNMVEGALYCKTFRAIRRLLSLRLIVYLNVMYSLFVT